MTPEFMHRRGEFFVIGERGREIHILRLVKAGYTPADSECEDYFAVCGLESQSWSMPAGGIEGAVFLNGEELFTRHLYLCEGCFSPQ
jgi:hypothetical protein